MQAIVLAVPMTAQVPAVVASLPSMSSISSLVDLARAVLAPRSGGSRCRRRGARRDGGRSASARRRAGWPARSAEAAPISCAGTVLSQPPISTTASIGCARIISSTSIAIRLRNIMLVGLRKTSPSEIVGKSSGKPPAARTPRFTASTSSGMYRWQLLKPLGDCAMPDHGLARAAPRIAPSIARTSAAGSARNRGRRNW